MVKRNLVLTPLAVLLLGGCTTVPRAPTPVSVPERDGMETVRPVKDDIYQGRSPSVVRYDRYTLVNTRSQEAQRDLLNQLIDISIPPQRVHSVGEALRYVLFESGFTLCPADRPELTVLLNRPLPAVQRTLGPVKLQEALQILAGPAWYLVVDEVSRQVYYRLRDGYSVPVAPAPVALPLASQPVMTPSTAMNALQPAPPVPPVASSVSGLSTPDRLLSPPTMAFTPPTLQVVKYLGAAETVDIRQGRGQGALASVLKQIAPAGWEVVVSSDLATATKGKTYHWQGCDRWTHVLDTLLQSQQWRALVNWQNHRISVVALAGSESSANNAGGTQNVISTPVTPPIVPATPVAPATATPNNLTGVPTGKTATQEDKPVTPVLLPSVTPPVSTSSTSAAPAVFTPGPAVITAPVGKAWSATVGATLRESVTHWAQEAPCQGSGQWVVIWPTRLDYRIDAQLTFHGPFEDVLSQLFELYRQADKPLFVAANRLQCLVHVDDKPQATR
ncbi:TcpQ domain-containing protein [Chania multitudinisentens]|uniref:PFGI-1 class ICE element type IV pilus protein PilL2 n=1 Tax=Chania multitudinisentens TaxID=1639108 RepID=UPI0003E13FCE|nr:TcpQ domain-containing protein [Chania multitudinisentens]